MNERTSEPRGAALILCGLPVTRLNGQHQGGGQSVGTPSQHCRGTFEQGTELPQIGPISVRVVQVYPVFMTQLWMGP